MGWLTNVANKIETGTKKIWNKIERAKEALRERSPERTTIPIPLPTPAPTAPPSTVILTTPTTTTASTPPTTSTSFPTVFPTTTSSSTTLPSEQSTTTQMITAPSIDLHGTTTETTIHDTVRNFWYDEIYGVEGRIVLVSLVIILTFLVVCFVVCCRRKRYPSLPRYPPPPIPIRSTNGARSGYYEMYNSIAVAPRSIQSMSMPISLSDQADAPMLEQIPEQ